MTPELSDLDALDGGAPVTRRRATWPVFVIVRADGRFYQEYFARRLPVAGRRPMGAGSEVGLEAAERDSVVEEDEQEAR